MNVFDDQRFLLRARSRDGTQEVPLTLSWREMMTLDETQPLTADGHEILPDTLRFNYPHEPMNVGALGLCIALTQAFFEPAGVRELIDRLGKPLSIKEFEAGIAEHRKEFGIDEGNRFLQGPEPARDPKGRLGTGPLSELLLSVKKGDKELLNRPTENWCVRVDQIPVFLFTRMTFYEKSAGRGYLTGTSGDLEIRTYLIDPKSLRRSIWLNVLTAQRQTGHFTSPGSKTGYDKWMWISPPRDQDVAQGALSLRAGLFWMVANAWIDIRVLENPQQCIVTGDILNPGDRAGTGVVVGATGIGFGAKVQRDSGPEVRQSFFLHPNAPYQEVTPTKGPSFIRHLAVDEASGLIGQMGGLFFATAGGASKGFHIAPIIDQMYKIIDEFERRGLEAGTARYDMLCFGFHMLSSKKNVHGGYEVELYNYPILGSGESERSEALGIAESIVNGCASNTDKVAYALRRSIQRCMLTGTNTSLDEKGHLVFTDKERVDEGALLDATKELWRIAGDMLHDLLKAIGETGRSVETLESSAQSLSNGWMDGIAAAAERIFHRYFNDYTASSQHIVAAHDARRMFYNHLRSIDNGWYERRNNSRDNS